MKIGKIISYSLSAKIQKALSFLNQYFILHLHYNIFPH